MYNIVNQNHNKNLFLMSSLTRLPLCTSTITALLCSLSLFFFFFFFFYLFYEIDEDILSCLILTLSFGILTLSFGILTLSFGILTLSFDRSHQTVVDWFKDSKWFEKKSNNGFVDCGLWIVVNLSYNSIAKEGRKDRLKLKMVEEEHKAVWLSNYVSWLTQFCRIIIVVF